MKRRIGMWAAILALLVPSVAGAVSWVEYPAHPATYGDHVINATWTGGPSAVTVTFESDEAILHGDGIGQSQRTARNTLNYVAPSDPSNPQDYDELRVITYYGTRLPLLQQMSANGTSLLRYTFTTPVTVGLDLFVTDLDTDDAAVVRAYGPGNIPIDMTTWTLRAQGDLSLYKNTGTAYSPIVAPVPTTAFAPGGISVTAANNMNYNRTFSILAAPPGTAVEKIEITFTGIQNSASRAAGGTGSHIYLALSTTLGTVGVPDGENARLRVAPNPSDREAVVEFTVRQDAEVRIDVLDVLGRHVRNLSDGRLNAGPHHVLWNGHDDAGRRVPAGIYFVKIDVRDEPAPKTIRIVRR